MTLILSLAAPNFVVQVADRMLTSTDGSRQSTANKMVVFCNRMTFSCTGLAQLPMRDRSVWLSVDKWLCDTLSDSPDDSLSSALAHVTERATEDMSRVIPMPGNEWCKALTFAGVGFAMRPGDDRYYPIACRISNSYGDKGERLGVPRAAFTLSYQVYSTSPPWGWMADGWPMTATELNSLHRAVKQCFRHHTGPHPIVRLFTNAIRGVAGRAREVGKDVLAAMIPQIAAALDVAVLANPSSGVAFFSAKHDSIEDVIAAMQSPMQSPMQFESIPDGSDKGVQHGPHFAHIGSSMKSVTVTRLHQ